MAFVPWKDRVTATPHRYKLTEVGADTYDLEAVPGAVSEAGTPVNAESLDRLIQRDGDDIKDTVTTFTEASTRANIATGESTSTIFGKIKKWLSDLKPHAFANPSTSLNNGTTTVPSDKLLASETALITRQNINVNPNFAINTNGLSSYTGDGTAACDGWSIAGWNSTITMLTNGIRFSAINNAVNRAVRQFMTRYALWAGITITFAVKVVAITGSAQIAINDGVSATTASFATVGTHFVTKTINAAPTNLFFQIATSNIANSSIDIEYAYAIQGSYLSEFQPEQIGIEYAKNQLYLNKSNISTVMPISSAAASNEKVYSEKLAFDQLALKAPTNNPTFTGTVIVPTTPSGPSAAVAKVYADSLRTVYDKVIRTQTEFEALIDSETWLGAVSVAIVGQFTLSTANNSGIKIPATVKQIHGYNSAKITITNFLYNLSTAKGGLWYDTAPTTNDYSIRDLEVDCTGAETGFGFGNCTNLTNCFGTGTGTTGSYFGYGFYSCTNLTNCTGEGTGTGVGSSGFGFNSCTNLTNCTGEGTGAANGYGFHTCLNLTNCTGEGTGAANGYGFYTITRASNCKDGVSSTDMWGGTNINIDLDTCCKNASLTPANNTTLNT